MREQLCKLPKIHPRQEGSLPQRPATPQDTLSTRELRGKPQTA